MTSIEKVRFAEQQVIAVATGRSDRIDCPFCCATTTRQQMLLCCEAMADLTDVVLDRIDIGDSLSIAQEAVGRQRQLADRYRQNLISLN